MDRKLIHPGDSAQLAVSYEATSAESDAVTTAKVSIGEPPFLLWELVVRAKVRQPLSLSPQVVDFGHVELASPGSAQSRLLEVRRFFSEGPSGEPVITSGCSWCYTGDCEPIEQLVESYGRNTIWAWRVPIWLNLDGMPAGKHEAFLTVELANESAVVPVRVVVGPDLRLLPSRLFFGEVSPGEGATRTLVVIARKSKLGAVGDQSMTLEVSHDKSLPIDVVSNQVAGNRWLVEVSLAGAATESPGVVSGSISVVVTDEYGRQVNSDVPVSFRVRSGG